MKIGIITFHRAYNCGAVLQAWALKTQLERMGHSVEFPICNHIGETKSRWRAKIPKGRTGFSWLKGALGALMVNALSIGMDDDKRIFADFRSRRLPERDCKVEELARFYDLIVVGSDQVWRTFFTGSSASVFFGESLPSGLPRIGYAVSYGDRAVHGAELERIVAAVDRFNSVSAREDLVREQLTPLVSKDIQVVLDPTLVLEAHDYDDLGADCIPPEKYLFCYTISQSMFVFNTVKKLAGALGLKAIIAPGYYYSRYKMPGGLTKHISPDKLISYTRNAECVIAGSFHGTALGIVFNKPLLSIRNECGEKYSRPLSLLRQLNEEKRLVTPETKIDDMLQMLSDPIGGAARERLGVLRDKSKAWLSDAIDDAMKDVW